MAKIVPTTIIMIVLVIAGFSLIQSFDASAEPVTLSDAAMRKLIGGCDVGPPAQIDPGKYSKGHVTHGRGALKKCPSISPCPSGSATWIFSRVACDPCSRSKWQLNKECGHERLITRCVLDEEGKCERKRTYRDSTWSCDHGNGRKCS